MLYIAGYFLGKNFHELSSFVKILPCMDNQYVGALNNLCIITRNEITFLYVLLECFKWISMYFKASNAINPYNIDSL